MRRALLLNLCAAIALAMLIAFSSGRAQEAADKVSVNNDGTRSAIEPTPRSNTDDLQIAGAATWFAYADVAHRIDEIAKDLDEINRGENAAALRAVALHLRQEMQKLDPATQLRSGDQPMVFGGVPLYR